MKKLTVMLLMLLSSMFLFFSCVSFNPSLGIMTFGQKTTEEYQTLEGIENIESLVIIPVGSSFRDYDDMGLKITKIALNRNTQKFVFQAEVHTGGSFTFWDSISVKLDNHIYNLKDNNPERYVRYSNYFLEVLTFEISPEMLKEIKITNTFSVELFRRVVTLNEKELQTLKVFCSK